MAETGQGFNLGSAYGQIVLTADTSALTGVQTTLQNMFSGVGGAFSNIGSTLTGIGGGLTALTAPLTLAGKQGVETAADFEMLMNQIEVFGNVAPENLESVRQFALKMGADTKFSASDAAGALLNLLKAGYSTTDAMAALPSVMEMATAGGISLGQASMITTAALSQFQLAAGDAATVSDLLARGAGASNADVGDLGLALANVGPVAKMFGLSLEDTVAVLGVMANNGIKGAEAGTMLKSTLMNLNRPTKEVQGALNELGVSLYDANGNARPFNDILLDLDSALSKLPVEQQNEIMTQLGGSYGIVGLSSLLAADGIDEMKTAMKNSAGASTVANRMMQGFSGKVESLKGSIETLMIEALTPFMQNVLGPLVDKIIQVVNGITEWVQANPELAQQIIQILAVVSTAAPIILGLGLAFSALGSVISGLGTAIGLLTSPIGLLIGAVALIGWAFSTNFLGIRDTVMPILQALYDWFVTTALPAIVNFVNTVVVPGIQSFINTLGQIWAVVAPGLQALWDWFTTSALPAIVNFVNTVVIPAVQMFVGALANIWNAVAPALQSFWDWFLVTGLPAIRDFIVNEVLPRVTDFINLLSGIWTTISPALQSVLDWFTLTALPAVVDFITNTVIPAVQGFIDTVSAIWSVISPYLEDLKNGIEAAFNWIKTNVIEPIVGKVQEFIDKLRELKAIADEISGRITSGLNAWQGIGQNAQAAAAMVQSGQVTPGQFFGALGNAISNEVTYNAGRGGLGASLVNSASGQARLNQLRNRDSGGMGEPGVPYLIGRGAQPELFVPSSPGAFYPNAGAGAGGLNIQSVTINASTYEGGVAAARGFQEEIYRLSQARGAA